MADRELIDLSSEEVSAKNWRSAFEEFLQTISPPGDLYDLRNLPAAFKAGRASRNSEPDWKLLLWDEFIKSISDLPEARSLGPYDENPLKAWHGLFVWMREILASRDAEVLEGLAQVQVLRKALQCIRKTVGLIDCTQDADTCGACSALDLIDGALAFIAAPHPGEPQSKEENQPMARKEQIVCDICGKQKQETNHWFVVSLSGNRISIMGRQHVSDGDRVFDCCGESCVMNRVSELLNRC